LNSDIKCGSCNVTAWPQMSLNAAGKIAPACPSCGHEHPNMELADFQVGKPVDGERKALPEVSIQRAAPATAKPAPTATSAPNPTQTFDVIGAVRDRLTFLGSEEARLDGVMADARARLAGIRVEAKKLRRMIGAADRVVSVSESGISLRAPGDIVIQTTRQ
jgi:hypothetical protein